MARRKARGGRAGVRRGELTPEEIASTGAVAGSGFTVRASGRGAGRPARDVLSTGFSPEIGRASEVEINPSMSAAEQIAAFNKSRIDDLSAPGASMAIGGWTDPNTGLVVQDASVITPRTMRGLEAAMQIGSYGNQQSVGNLGPQGYEGDIDIPKHLQRGQFAWHESEDIEPRVEQSGNVVKITPSRKEMVSVEAEGMMKGWFKDKEGNVIPPPFKVPLSKVDK